MVNVLADIPGDGVTHPITADLTQTVSGWIQFIVTGSGIARIGDANTTSSRGFPVPAGGGMFYPWRKRPQSSAYVLGQIYYNVPVGATLTIGYSTD